MIKQEYRGLALVVVPFLAIILIVASINLWYGCDVAGKAGDCRVWAWVQWIWRLLAAAAILGGTFLTAFHIQEALAYPSRTPVYVAFGGVVLAALCAFLTNISFFLIAGVVIVVGVLTSILQPHHLFKAVSRMIGLHRYLAWQLRRTLRGRTPALAEHTFFGHISTKGHTFEFGSPQEDPPPSPNRLPMLEITRPDDLVKQLATGSFAESPQAVWRIVRVGWLVYLILDLEFPNGQTYAIPLCVGQQTRGKSLKTRSTYLDVQWAMPWGFLSALKQSNQIGIGAFASPDTMRGVVVKLSQPFDITPYSVALSDEDKDIKANPHRARWQIEDHVVIYLTTGQFHVTPGWWERQQEMKRRDLQRG